MKYARVVRSILVRKNGKAVPSVGKGKRKGKDKGKGPATKKARYSGGNGELPSNLTKVCSCGV